MRLWGRIADRRHAPKVIRVVAQFPGMRVCCRSGELRHNIAVGLQPNLERSSDLYVPIRSVASVKTPETVFILFQEVIHDSNSDCHVGVSPPADR